MECQAKKREHFRHLFAFNQDCKIKVVSNNAEYIID